MKTTVEIGKTYALRSEAGGEVTDVDGKPLESLEPNKQVHMTAQESEWLVPDDCKVTKANFKQAALALGLLGGGKNDLPAGYTRLEFLESTGTQAIVLPVNKNDAQSWSTRTEVQITELPAPNTGAQEGCTPQYQWGLWGSASGGTSVFMAANNASGNLSLGKVSELSSSWTTVAFGFDAPSHRWGSWGSNSAEDDGSKGTPNVTEFCLFCAKRYDGFAYFQNARKKWLILKADGVTLYSLIPALTPVGEPCMFDRVSKQPFRNARTGSFIAGVGTVAQLTALLHRLPATAGKLTLSLPAEANTPEVAEALQACHDTKGWTLTVHEYRPAEAATYSLRRVREVVWCRRELSEYGSYVDADGFRWQIDRCAAIFGALGQDPAAYCYTPFDSVEQAVEFWELEPYVEPDMEEVAD